jgi:CheY-like chemotaxis protein
VGPKRSLPKLFDHLVGDRKKVGRDGEAYGALVPQEDFKSEASRGRPGESILVVEDDGDVRAYVVETLGALGYEVREASGAEDALRDLEEHKETSLLLTDVIMPRMNGRQLADAARERRPELKVVFMTGYSRNAHRASGPARRRHRAATKAHEQGAAGRYNSPGPG